MPCFEFQDIAFHHEFGRGVIASVKPDGTYLFIPALELWQTVGTDIALGNAGVITAQDSELSELPLPSSSLQYQNHD